MRRLILRIAAKRGVALSCEYHSHLCAGDLTRALRAPGAFLPFFFLSPTSHHRGAVIPLGGGAAIIIAL